MRGAAAAGCVETKLLRLPGAARNLGLRGNQIPAWQRPSSCAAAVLVRHVHEQHRDHCVAHHDVMLPLSLLMVRSLDVIELAAIDSLDSGMTYRSHSLTHGNTASHA